MNSRDQKLSALQFNDFINRHDTDGLSILMTPDHTFIDRVDATVVGKDAVKHRWVEFFQTYPEYRNTFSRVETVGDVVVLLGYATWTPNSEPDHAIWTAKIENDLVAEWRIYFDTPENREMFSL